MRTPHPLAKHAAARGSVLIVVMFVCLGLVSIALVFGHTMLLAARAQDNALAGRQAQQAIEGGARYAQALFVTQVPREGGMPDPATFYSERLSVGEASFWFIGNPSNNANAAVTGSVAASSGSNGQTPVFGFVDEASKLNLNTATQGMLLGLPGMTQDLAAAIVAWRSRTASSGTGSAAAAYQILLNNTGVKAAPFETVEELSLILSSTGSLNSAGSQDLLYGADFNANHVQDANEPSQLESYTPPVSTGSGGGSFDLSDNGFHPGLLEYVTVWSREPNTLSDGTTARVNVAQRSGTALNTLLTDNLGASRAGEVMQKLAASGTQSVNSVLGFYVLGGLTETEFEKIAQQLTATSGQYARGLINANTASATVLACVPGIGAAKAQQLTAARAQWASPPASLAWVVPILGQADALRAGPYLTANSYQLSVDIAAVGRGGRGYRRARFVIDKSSGAPLIVYRRNLTPLGWALGDAALSTP